ncbi:MAG: hypothetical protein GXP49_07525 [Deltaproteobacteria bacterium]|nr:hypothetical protein [Deltaproteobacteria bacterium]
MAIGYKPIKGNKKFSFTGLIMVLIPVVLVYGAIVYVPVWWNDVSVEEVLHKWANTAYRHRDIETISKGIKGDLSRLGIEVDPDKLVISFEQPDKDYIYIDLEYSVESKLPLLGRTVTTHWKHHVENDLSRVVW